MGKDLKGKELGRNLSQRKDGRYEAKYTDAYGKRHSIYGEKLSEVRKGLNEALYKKEHNIYNPKKSFTFDDWFDIWLNTYKKNQVRITTLSRICRYYDSYIKDKLGFMELEKIRPLLLQNFYNDLSSLNLSRYTTLHIHSIIKEMYKCAILNGYVSNNPCDCVKLKLSPENKDKRVLTKEEQDLFFKYAKQYVYYDMFKLFLLTGLRAGEMVALTWDDVDFENKTLAINKTYINLSGCDFELIKKYDIDFNEVNEEKNRFHAPKTKKSIRKIPLTNQAFEILQTLYSKKVDECNYIFHTKTNKPILISNIGWAIIRISKRINKYEPEKNFKYFFPHTFRRTFATRCFEIGIQPKVVQEYLGHENLSTTMDVYTYVNEDLKHSEIEKIDSAVKF
jgi:integrase